MKMPKKPRRRKDAEIYQRALKDDISCLVSYNCTYLRIFLKLPRSSDLTSPTPRVCHELCVSSVGKSDSQHYFLHVLTPRTFKSMHGMVEKSPTAICFIAIRMNVVNADELESLPTGNWTYASRFGVLDKAHDVKWLPLAESLPITSNYVHFPIVYIYLFIVLSFEEKWSQGLHMCTYIHLQKCCECTCKIKTSLLPGIGTRTTRKQPRLYLPENRYANDSLCWDWTVGSNIFVFG